MAGTLGRLYSGTGVFDVVGRRRVWYSLSGLLVVVCLASILLRGFNLGIDFEGGTQVQLPAQGAGGRITTQQAERVFTDTVGRPPASVQTVGTGAAASILISSSALDTRTSFVLKHALYERLRLLGTAGRPSEQAISDSAVSATWGGEISRQALIALLVFLGLVSAFLAVYFEPRMALAALIALVHDVLVTAGIYSLVGFEVTPASVIGLLTILGFSLYDTVVVFDKVQENTRGLLGLTRRTYAEAANLAVNQTLMRSINTSLIAVLPVLSLLVVGVGLLGVGTLKDLALVQMIGIMAGAMSSIFLATPLMVDLTMRRPAYRQQAERVAARREKSARRTASESGRSAQEGETPSTATGPTAPAEDALAPAATTAKVGKTASGGRRRGHPAGKSGRPSGKAGRSSGR
ncbi:MAG: protein translocase subunit SecF [Pseudonocardiales bacterium]|nr:protein translocase subunit SecF [Pseudonocardiales bacterium]MBV9029986.1 protein translocase subunit SecF [Pseudonocardiales bacterium]